jgi:hypothetical protein
MTISFDRSQYLTPAELVSRWAEHPLFSTSYVTLARRRAAGKEPAFIHAGHNSSRVFYKLDDIIAYELAHLPHQQEHAIPERQPLQERPEGEGQSA